MPMHVWYRTRVSLRTCIYADFQLPSGFLRPVDDRFSFNPLRNTQAGARRSASRAAWVSGMR
ncbi:hypothetical protein BRAS3843_3160010 [Bradyrhizobium sp. STM 3843]|nr:hypothetical protein BRAS3843_3160010 [Bradyrhizobium sp. STM 3843]